MSTSPTSSPLSASASTTTPKSTSKKRSMAERIRESPKVARLVTLVNIDTDECKAYCEALQDPVYKETQKGRQIVEKGRLLWTQLRDDKTDAYIGDFEEGPYEDLKELLEVIKDGPEEELAARMSFIRKCTIFDMLPETNVLPEDGDNIFFNRATGHKMYMGQPVFNCNVRWLAK